MQWVDAFVSQIDGVHVSENVSFVRMEGGTHSRDSEETQILHDAGRCWIDARSSELGGGDSQTQMRNVNNFKSNTSCVLYRLRLMIFAPGL